MALYNVFTLFYNVSIVVYNVRYQITFFKVPSFLQSFRVLINKLSKIMQNTALQTPRTKQFVEITT